jgi:hypothetical protein
MLRLDGRRPTVCTWLATDAPHAKEAHREVETELGYLEYGWK